MNTPVQTYPEMNQQIAGVLRLGGTEPDLYAAARIEELEIQLKRAEKWRVIACKCWERASPDTDDDIGREAVIAFLDAVERLIEEEMGEAHGRRGEVL